MVYIQIIQMLVSSACAEPSLWNVHESIAGLKNGHSDYIENVSGTEKKFKLVNGMYEDETLSYVPVNDDDNTVCFVLSADNGLNGANVTWQFPGMPSLNGSTTVPEYRTTAEQLANFVPYVEYISSGLMINGIKWRIVSLDNEAIPFPQDFEMKIKIYNVYGEDSNIAYQDLDEFKTIPAGETPERLILL